MIDATGFLRGFRPTDILQSLPGPSRSISELHDLGSYDADARQEIAIQWGGDGHGYAIYEVVDWCAADLTGDGGLNTNDFFMFPTLYQAVDLRADFTADGNVDTNDFFEFLAQYQAEC